jgi:hypothetical protein
MQAAQGVGNRLTCAQACRAEADGRSLVLLDELGTGTDPVEGAALGVALLKRMAAGGCLSHLLCRHMCVCAHYALVFICAYCLIMCEPACARLHSELEDAQVLPLEGNQLCSFCLTLKRTCASNTVTARVCN